VNVDVVFSRDKAARTITIRTGTRNSVTSVTDRHQNGEVTLDDADDALSRFSSNGPAAGDSEYLDYVAAVHAAGQITMGEALELELHHQAMRRVRAAEPEPTQ
jgi:hypothetical protein